MGKHKKYGLSRHHVIPRSRGGSGLENNITGLKLQDHQDYHNLFSNQIPTEIVETLVNKYWKGNWDYVKEAYDKR